MGAGCAKKYTCVHVLFVMLVISFFLQISCKFVENSPILIFEKRFISRENDLTNSVYQNWV